MFRSVLSLTFAVSFATAATITTSATCDGIVTTGSCNDGRVSAFARLDIRGFDEVEVNPIRFPSSGSASAHFSDDYVFTVSGGTGSGLFMPCFTASAGFSSGSVVSVSMGFGGVGFGRNSFGTSGNCFGGPDPFFERPFTFGVPQIVNFNIDGFASSARSEIDALETLTEIQFFDTAGHQLSNVTFTLVSTSIPETSTLSLLTVGLVFLVAVRIRGMRYGAWRGV